MVNLNCMTSYLSWNTQTAHTAKSAPANESAKQPLGDHKVRESYNVKISEAYQEFKTQFQEFHDREQCFGGDLALEAYKTRSKIKEEHQEQTTYMARAAIWLRNMLMYGSDNATYESLSKKKNPEEIAYSAFKTGGGDLGLKNNGFGEKLDVWNAIKNVSQLYPEDITNRMIDVYKVQKPGKVDVDAILAARVDTTPANSLLHFIAHRENTVKSYA